jgi:hypothetical protein
MNYLRTSLLQIALLLTQAPFALAATTWYVNGVNGSDSHNCRSPLTACKTIGHAISLAASGDAVTIAAATYVENVTIPVSLTVTGSGAGGTIIDGNAHTSVVKIPNASTHVTLSNVTLRNGHAVGGCAVRGVAYVIPSCGGGVYNAGTLTMNNSVIISNVAWGHRCGPFPGHDYCLQYEPDGFGGGIYNTGTLKINRTTIAGNEAGGSCVAGGGGIYNLGMLTINASILSGNRALETSICSASTSKVGGIDNVGTAEINNSTLARNVTILHSNWQHEGGGIVISGILSVHSSTVSGNLGGIVGAVTLQNSIVANNASGGIPNVSGGINCNGPVTSIFSLSSDGTCHLNGPGDKNNTSPRLEPLGYYGGPTQTIPLLSGSPAIDAGNPSGCTDGLGRLLRTDQRGMPRPTLRTRRLRHGGLTKAGD